MRRRLGLTGLASAIALVACAVWAWRSLESPGGADRSVARAERAPAERAGVRSRLDVEAFAAPIWNPSVESAAPSEAAPDAAARKRAAFKLQLISLIEEHGRLSAAIYDPGDDALHVVAVGDQINAYAVTSITTDGVELSSARGSHRLVLREDRK